ncbi:MAG: Trk family potassium uptake protein [Lachnospiraceae bacterium]|nr:Trk family potassium uptake protein [Lachnospiraceae bacterium]
MKEKKRTIKQSTASFRVIIAGFFSIILLGALLLSLPVSSATGEFTPFSDAIFTSVSATCVTGLVVRDTATYWSVFGQLVILILIQIGGMGVITIGLLLLRAMGRKIGLRQREMMKGSISAGSLGGIMHLAGFIIKGSLLVELTGALLLSPRFISEFGFFRGVYYSIFHSVSAFCNAGFDLMGIKTSFSSLTSYAGSVYVNVIIMLLIIIGGIGFLTWNDVKTNRHHISKYSLQSKIILFTSLTLIIVPAVLFFVFEFSDLPMKERILSSLFQSVTTRTAGFNTADLTAISQPGIFIMIILMLVGGSPGSTAGGMKTTTIAVLFLAAVAVFGRKKDVTGFKRRIPEDAIRSAGAILFMYIALFIGAALIISRVESLPLLSCLFETGSAIGTVGLTLGITPSLSLASRLLLMILMFFGRVGGLTLIYAALPSEGASGSGLPLENINVG